MTDVLGDADHRPVHRNIILRQAGLVVSIPLHRDPLPDWILAWPVALGQRFIDDGDRRTRCVIGQREAAAPDDRDAHGVEVIRVDDHVEHGVPVILVAGVHTFW